MNMSYDEMRASTGHGAGARGQREDGILAPRASCLDPEKRVSSLRD